MTEIRLQNLPNDAIECIATHLPIPALIRFALTCKSVASVAISERQFRRRILTAYSLGIKRMPHGSSFKEVYRRLHEQKATAPLRFQALGTDGGVDSSGARHMLYWVDNMFVNNHLEAYCTETGSGIAVFASLQECGETRQDKQRKEKVEFLRKILHVPLRHLLPVNETGDYMHRRLESWTLTDLERFLTELWANGPQPADQPGPWLRESVQNLVSAGYCRTEIIARMHGIVQSFQDRFLGNDDANVISVIRRNEENPLRLQHDSYNVVADPKNRNAIVDADLMPLFLSGPSEDTHSLGIISHIEVNRKGGQFSCPVRSGAILSCVHTGWEGSAVGGSSQQGWFKGMATMESSSLTVLRNCNSFAVLQQHIADGELPPVLSVQVHRGRNHFQGVTVEFEEACPSAVQELQPLMWFQFFSAYEDQDLQKWEASFLDWEASVLDSEAETGTARDDSGKDLPAALGWVKRFFNPHQPATGCTAGEATSCELKGSALSKSGNTIYCSDAGSDDESGRAHAGSSAAQGATVDTSVGTDEFASNEGESDSDSESEDWQLGADDVQRLKTICGRHKLKTPLRKHRTANLVSVVLADQENLMQHYGDGHLFPNIDISYVKFTGQEVRVPTGAVFYSQTELQSALA